MITSSHSSTMELSYYTTQTTYKSRNLDQVPSAMHRVSINRNKPFICQIIRECLHLFFNVC